MAIRGGKSDAPIVQSLFDRLSYRYNPETQSEDWSTTRQGTLRMYREGIKRDVEWLLNTRRPKVSQVEGYPLAANSVFNFGLPDFADTPGAGADPEVVLTLIMHTLRNYEPRIRDPQVTLARTDTLARSLRFHVEGTLLLETGEEDITFDTVLETSSGDFAVK